MTNDEIKSYRDTVINDSREIDKDLKERVSLIIIASLGFLISKIETINDAKNPWLLTLLFMAGVPLLSAFTVFLINIHKAGNEAEDIIIYLDDCMKPNDEKCNQELLEKWLKSFKRKNAFKSMVYLLLAIGILFEVAFFTYNTLIKKNTENYPQPFKVEISK